MALRNEELSHSIYLLLASLVWGFAFVAQSVGMEYLGPFSFNALRFFLGFVVLGIFLWPKRKRVFHASLYRSGLLLGSCLFVANSLQQIGLLYTSAGKAGFLTAFYIVLVPLLHFVMGKKSHGSLVLAVILAMTGLFFLTGMQGDLQLGRGERYCLAGAFFFALHILLVERMAPKQDPRALSALQFLVGGSLSLLTAYFLESASLDDIWRSKWPILYAGVMSCALAYTLQVMGQRKVHAGLAALIMSLESVFAVLGGFLILEEALSSAEAWGCALIFLAILVSQWPALQALRRSRKKQSSALS